MVESVLKVCCYQFMLLVDIVVLCDIELQVGKFNDVYFYLVDDLQLIVDSNIEQCKVEVIQVEVIVSEESVIFMSWMCLL